MQLPCSFRKLSEEFKTHKEDWDDHGEAWVVCFGVFFLPLVLYQIFVQDQLLDRPVAFDVGIVTVSAAFGGFLLNAGVSTDVPNRRETIRVAKKFIYVVVLTVLSLPVLQVEFIGGVNVTRPIPIVWRLGFEGSTFGLLQFRSSWPSFYSSLP